MKILQKIVLLLLLLTFSTNSYGVVYFEPLLGINSGQSEISSLVVSSSSPTVSINASSSYDRTGVFYGARIGLGVDKNISFGIDYRIAEVDAVPKNPSASLGSVEFKNTSFGLYLRYNDFLPLWHIWGTYYLVNNREVSGSEVTGTSFLKVGALHSGKKHSLGIGYSMLPFVNINLEFSSFRFETYENPFSNTTGLSGRIFDLPEEGGYDGYDVLLSISVPMDIGI